MEPTLVNSTVPTRGLNVPPVRFQFAPTQALIDNHRVVGEGSGFQVSDVDHAAGDYR
jgi:hypothetical protein